MSKDQLYILFVIRLYNFGPMLFSPSKKKAPFLKNILIQKRKTAKSIMHLPIKQIGPDERTQHIIHAKNYIQNKLDKRSKFKLLFQALAESNNHSPYIFSHLQKKSTEDKVRKRSKTDSWNIPKINEVIFKTEIQAFAQKIDHKKIPSRELSQKSLKEAKFSFANLRRSFKISDHCKSSLLNLSLKNRTKKFESGYSSISYSNIKAKPFQPIKRQYSLRIPSRPKRKVIECGVARNQIKGWEETPMRYLSPSSPINFSNQY